VPDQVLRIAFSIVLILSGIKLVKLPAANTIVEVGAGLSVAALILWSVLMLRTRRVPAHDAA